MTRDDLLYTAGLFDGEGTVTLCRDHGGPYRVPRVSVSSCTPELMKYLKETFGGCISSKPPRKENHKFAWAWSLSFNGALGFLKDISPYLKEPEKKARAEFMLANYKAVTNRNGKYTVAQDTRKLRFEKEFFEIGRELVSTTSQVTNWP